MKTIFLIGGMGSGKSSVARLFNELGIPILDLDKVGHQVLEHASVKRSLCQAFGEDILDDQGRVVRSALASEAFASPSNTAELTAITAPAIIEQMNLWLDAQNQKGASCALVEVSAYVGTEGPYAKLADAVVAVVAPVDLRVERAAAKGFAQVDVCRRIMRQPTDIERQGWAHYVIENDGGMEDLRKQVKSTLNALKCSLSIIS